MSIDEFAGVTRRVIVRDGFDGYQPTACFPKRRHVSVLTGVPNHVDMEEASVKWAGSKAEQNEEFLVAFKLDALHFKVVHCAGGKREERAYEIRQRDTGRDDSV